MAGRSLLIFGNRYLGFAAVCLAAAAMANAINLFDGLDALASGTTAIIAASHIRASARRALSPFACVVAASMSPPARLGFPPYNWPTAKIFLGDRRLHGLGASPLRFWPSIRAARSGVLTPSALALFQRSQLRFRLLDAVFAAIRRLRQSPLGAAR